MVLLSTSVRAGTSLKPYVVLILDTSGSMYGATGSGPPSCGGSDTKLDHARCAINNIVNSYGGDMVFAFGKFRETPTGTFATNCATDCNTTAFSPSCGSCNTGTNVASGCTLGEASDDNFQMLTALADGNTQQTSTYTDFACNTCAEPIGPLLGATNPEILFANSWTPLNGDFRGAKRYWSGQQFTADGAFTIWPAAQPGFNPIVNDSTSSIFLPAGSGCDPSPSCTSNCCTSQCRPYITIVLTDGDETCSYINNSWPTVGSVPTTYNVAASPNGASKAGTTATFTTTAAHTLAVGDTVVVSGVAVGGYNGSWTVATVASTTKFTVSMAAGALANSGGGSVGFTPGLLVTDLVTGAPATLKRYRIETKPIGFGTPVPYGQIENIAKAGGAVSIPGQNMGHYASDEASLELAFTQIIQDSIRSEVCNGLDDNCNGEIDEDFPCAVTCTGPTCTPSCNACNNGKLGVCKVSGSNVCRADGTGVSCNAGAAACSGQPDGTACTVTDTASLLVSGTCAAGICNPTPQTTCPPGKTCNPDNTEVCGDGLDNDCDGAIDEGCVICVPTAEVCNGKDDDCDGIIDEGITQQCPITNGFGTCLGTQSCVVGGTGTFTACTGQTPAAEICNNLDDDCDGIIDEDLNSTCSNITGNGCNTAPCPGTNNPNMGICHPGTEQCVAGAFGACAGEVTPKPEICNGLDDDCDGTIDEDTGGGACSTTCGTGTIVCATPPNCGGVGQPTCGTLFCNAPPPSATDATCNSVDEDCDGKVDEDWKCADPTGDSTPAVPCTCNMDNGTAVCNGVNKCINGAVKCVGDPPGVEICNCKDDDCDGVVDEDVTCPNGGTCTNCQCALPCGGGEFPCPAGKACKAGFCINDPCYNVTCPDVMGAKQSCVDNGNNTIACVDTCSLQTCNPSEVCVPSVGECKPNDCTTFPAMCTAAQSCVVDPNTGMGQCIGNPCSGVTCPSDQYCELGNCIQSCADVMCPSGERCRLGVCETDPCGHPCPGSQVCNDASHTCGDDPCGQHRCSQGQWCNPNDGLCEPDPCVGTMCPASTPPQICQGGTCNNPPVPPDAGVEVHVTTGGGGGCTTTGGGGGAGLLLGVMMMIVRRRAGRS